MRTKSIIEKGVTSSQWRWLNFMDYLSPFYIICTIPLFYLAWNYDFLFKGVIILITVVYLMRFGYPKSPTTSIFTVFFGVVVFSFIQYLYNDTPFICYINDASNYLAAMLFYYVGISDDRPGRTFYKKYLYVTVAVFAVGLLCYVTTPSWYVTRYLDIVNSKSLLAYSENNVLNDLRYSAFFGDSYAVSHLSVFAAAMAIFEIVSKKGKSLILPIVCLMIAILSSVASMHRASIVGSVIVLMMFFYYNHKTYRYSVNIKFALFCVLLLVGFLLFLPSVDDRMTNIFDMVTERVDDNMSLGKALDERKNTHELMASMRFFLFGHGLGSGGASARQFGLPGISDMQYLKMFFENGIVGAVLFILIIIRALSRGIKYIKYYLTEVSIVLFILVAMLGSNSLSIYYFYVFPFWYAVGRICNDSYFQHLKKQEWI